MSATISSGPDPTGDGVSDPLGTSTSATIELSVSSQTIGSCQPLNVTWTVSNGSADLDISTITLSYTNLGVSQTEGDTTYHPTGGSQNLGVTPISRLVWTWPAVFIQESGYYVIQASGSASPTPLIKQTSRFLVTVDDTSCFALSSSSPSSDLSTPTDEPSAPSNSPTEYSTPSSSKKTN
ncbi:15480_t:CDS:1, partial [Acaulospora colombiana]